MFDRIPIRWAGEEKEKEMLELCKEHLSEVSETVKSLREFLYLHFEKEIEESVERALNKVEVSEKEADETKDEILERLSEGIFHPFHREEIIDLVTSADYIADNAKAVALKLTFIKLENSENLDNGFKNLCNMACEAVESLRGAFELTLEEPKRAMKKTKEVEKIEEKADYFRAQNLLPNLVKWADKSNKAGTSDLLMQIEENLEAMLDQSEKSADIVKRIAIATI